MVFHFCRSCGSLPFSCFDITGQACQLAHSTCDDVRPCTRCTRKGLGAACVDAVKHGSWMAHGKRAQKHKQWARRAQQKSIQKAGEAQAESTPTTPNPQIIDGLVLHNLISSSPITFSDTTLESQSEVSETDKVNGPPDTEFSSDESSLDNIASPNTPIGYSSKLCSPRPHRMFHTYFETEISSPYFRRPRWSLYRQRYGEHVEEVARFFCGTRDLDNVFLQTYAHDFSTGILVPSAHQWYVGDSGNRHSPVGPISTHHNERGSWSDPQCEIHKR